MLNLPWKTNRKLQTDVNLKHFHQHVFSYSTREFKTINLGMEQLTGIKPFSEWRGVKIKFQIIYTRSSNSKW